jgi:hypothetical protein
MEWIAQQDKASQCNCGLLSLADNRAGMPRQLRSPWTGGGTTPRHASTAADPVRPCGLAEKYSPPQITLSRASNFVLESSQTTPWHYPESSGFGRRREREWGYRRHRRRVNQENPLMRIYIIGIILFHPEFKFDPRPLVNSK